MSRKQLTAAILCVAVIVVAGILIALQMGAFDRTGATGGPPSPTGPQFARLELKCPDCGAAPIRKVALLEGNIPVDPDSGELVCHKCRKAGAGVTCRSCGEVTRAIRVDHDKSEVYCGLCNKPVTGPPPED